MVVFWPGRAPGRTWRIKPPEVAGQTVRFALEQMKDVHDSLLVGVYDGDRCNVNPPSSPVIPTGADLLVVRERPI